MPANVPELRPLAAVARTYLPAPVGPVKLMAAPPTIVPGAGDGERVRRRGVGFDLVGRGAAEGIVARHVQRADAIAWGQDAVVGGLGGTGSGNQGADTLEGLAGADGKAARLGRHVEICAVEPASPTTIVGLLSIEPVELRASVPPLMVVAPV